jgi:ubiquinone/menaquinone biosynthesis C-methylase UbiE
MVAAGVEGEGAPMAERDGNRGFTDVDRTADPAAFVRHLDVLRALPAAAPYWRRKYELLAVGPGQRVLDLGCGAGGDTLALARLVGPTGRVVGIDRSEAMLAEARRRAGSRGLPVEFRSGDAHALDLPDGTFDVCHADRVLRHVADPPRVLGELVRVARPGGRLVVMEPDSETVAVDAPDRGLTRTLLNLACDGVRQGWMGRQLYALCRAAGLADVAVEAVPVILTDFAAADRLLWLGSTARRAVDEGVVSAAAAAAWLEGLREADRAGRFFAAIEGFLVSGRKP